MYREEFYYKAEYISIKNCREHIKSLSLKYNFYNIFIENIEISIGELFTNIIKHGQKGLAEENDIKINIFIDETRFEITFEYFGDIPTEDRISEVNRVKEIEHLEELSESGRGIYIINKLMDKLYFEKNGNVAKAVLIKFL